MNRASIGFIALLVLFGAVGAVYHLRLTSVEEELSQVRSLAHDAQAHVFALEAAEDSSPAVLNPPPPIVSESTAPPAALAPVTAQLKQTQVALDQALARIDDLETRFTEQQDQEPKAVTTFMSTRGSEGPETVAKHRGVILDPHATEQERLQALRGLRWQPADLEPYTPEVARELKRWLDNTEDASVRADIIRQLHRAKLTELKDSMIYFLQNDASEEVRDEAAETLEDFGDDDWVIQALERARDGDASHKVRATAAHTLEEIAEDAAKRAKHDR